MYTYTTVSSNANYNDGYEEGYKTGQLQIIDRIRCYLFYDLLAGFIFGVVFTFLIVEYLK